MGCQPLGQTFDVMQRRTLGSPGESGDDALACSWTELRPGWLLGGLALFFVAGLLLFSLQSAMKCLIIIEWRRLIIGVWPSPDLGACIWHCRCRVETRNRIGGGKLDKKVHPTDLRRMLEILVISHTSTHFPFRFVFLGLSTNSDSFPTG